MKRVFMDVSMIMVGTRFTGIPRVVMEVSRRLYEKKELQLVFLEFNQKKDAFEILDTEGFVQFCNIRSANRKKLRTGRFLSYDHMASFEEENQTVFLDMDTVWKTRVRRSFLYPKLKKQGITVVAHIYDIIPITHPQFCIEDDTLCFIDYVGAALQHADHFIVNSYATGHAIETLCKKIGIEKKEDIPSIHVIGLGGNFSKGNQIKEENIRGEIRQIGENKKYLLTVGTLEPRKNHKLLLDAYECGLKDINMEVVIVGFPGWNVEKLLCRIKKHPDYQKGIYYPENVNDDELQYLYQHCFALAFPSRIEGYGLPIMEAFVKGVPVIASDTEINQEIGGNYAVYFADDNVQDFIKTVKMMTDSNEIYKAQKEKLSQFMPPTWDQCGQSFGDFLLSL